MEYGVCAPIESAAILAAAGFDFIELHVQRDLRTTEGEDAFAPMLARIRQSAVPPIAANCFIPGELRITGPDVDMEALEAYASTAFERAVRSGIETIVFGSGGARRIPEGFDRGAAWQQLVRFGQCIGPIAAFAARLPNLLYYELLPFHPMANGKYQSLGMDYRAKDLKSPGKEQMRALADAARRYGIEVKHS